MKFYAGTHKVKRGESLLDIAKQYYGDPVAAKYISQANGGISKAHTGSVLKLPSGTAVGEKGMELIFNVDGGHAVATHEESMKMMSGGFKPQAGMQLGGIILDNDLDFSNIQVSGWTGATTVPTTTINTGGYDYTPGVQTNQPAQTAASTFREQQTTTASTPVQTAVTTPIPSGSPSQPAQAPSIPSVTANTSFWEPQINVTPTQEYFNMAPAQVQQSYGTQVPATDVLPNNPLTLTPTSYPTLQSMTPVLPNNPLTLTPTSFPTAGTSFQPGYERPRDPVNAGTTVGHSALLDVLNYAPTPNNPNLPMTMTPQQIQATTTSYLNFPHYIDQLLDSKAFGADPGMTMIYDYMVKPDTLSDTMLTMVDRVIKEQGGWAYTNALIAAFSGFVPLENLQIPRAALETLDVQNYLDPEWWNEFGQEMLDNGIPMEDIVATWLASFGYEYSESGQFMEVKEGGGIPAGTTSGGGGGGSGGGYGGYGGYGGRSSYGPQAYREYHNAIRGLMQWRGVGFA